jgi:hypothetical protein
MMKRSCLVVALGLLASLAFVTPSQAGPTFPLAYSYSVAQSGGPTITATSVNGGSGSATVHAAAAGSALAPLAPAATDSYISIASYTQHASGSGIGGPPTFAAQGGFYAAGSSVSEAVTVTYMGHTGVFNVVVSFAGQFVYTGNLATPSLTSSGPIVIDGVTFGVYEQATSFNNNTQVSSVKIGIEGTAVPEPTSMALLGIGMTSFLAFRRFFKRGSVA